MHVPVIKGDYAGDFCTLNCITGGLADCRAYEVCIGRARQRPVQLAACGDSC